MAHQPIENYGIIGDVHTTTLVGTDGSIDWLCLPRFDSPSVFAAIIDDQKGGCFKIAPVVDGVSRKQFYCQDTNVLATRFFTPDGVGHVMDYMPVGTHTNRPERARQLIRHVKVTRGTMTFRIECSGGEGTFSLCTFWLVEALTPAGRIAEARFVFEQMLSYAEHLGLYAEEIGPSGEALGNFPQAFTHLTLISSAFNLDRVLGAGR